MCYLHGCVLAERQECQWGQERGRSRIWVVRPRPRSRQFCVLVGIRCWRRSAVWLRCVPLTLSLSLSLSL